MGLSGGVDSATSAALLISQGYDVVGVTCVFQDDAVSRAAIADARKVCDHLGIQHVVHDVQALFEQTVIEPFCSSYCQGDTPSPCVRCNRYCKIPALIQAADEYDCEKVATGHYARIAFVDNLDRFAVLTATDVAKDQSYMLALLTQDQLSRLVLPLGELSKPEVRAYAEKLSLPVAHRPDSQDICFISGDYRVFLQGQGITAQPGPMMLQDGTEVGTHQGLFNYTLGQRKGLGVALGQPAFVLGKDRQRNALIIGFKDETLISSIVVSELNWVGAQPSTEPFSAFVKIRYRSLAVRAEIELQNSYTCCIRFETPQNLTAPGQYAVLYRDDCLLAGGMVSSVQFCNHSE